MTLFTKALLLLAALILSATAVFAQDQQLPDLPPEVGTTTVEPLTRDQALDLLSDRLLPTDQAALDNFRQTTSTTGQLLLVQQVGAQNTGITNQIGLGNVAALYQVGDNNVTAMLQQGNDNVIGIWLNGSDNQLDVQQLGDRNVYLLEFIGDGLGLGEALPAIQIGNDNQAVQFGQGTQPYGVVQIGSGIEMTIEHIPGGGAP